MFVGLQSPQGMDHFTLTSGGETFAYREGRATLLSPEGFY